MVRVLQPLGHQSRDDDGVMKLIAGIAGQLQVSAQVGHRLRPNPSSSYPSDLRELWCAICANSLTAIFIGGSLFFQRDL